MAKKKGNLLQSLRAHQAQAEITAKRKAQEVAYAPSTTQSKKRKREHSSVLSDATVSTPLPPSALSKGKGKVTIPFHQNRRVLLVGEGELNCILYQARRRYTTTHKAAYF